MINNKGLTISIVWKENEELKDKLQGINRRLEEEREVVRDLATYIRESESSKNVTLRGLTNSWATCLDAITIDISS